MTATQERASHAVPPQVLTALDALGVEPATVTPMTSDVPWSRRPRTFMVTTADRTPLKARVCVNTHWAQRAASLAKRLDDPAIAVPLGHVGRVTVEPWVDGAPLCSMPPAAEHVSAAADLLRRIHRFPGINGERLPRSRATRGLRSAVRGCVADLTAAGVLHPGDARGVTEIVERGLPVTAAWGLMHGDLCGANLVVRPGGDLVSIDNEHIRRGFLEFDLARTWYRWPLPADAEGEFACRYTGEIAGSAGSTARVRAWRAVAAIRALHMRYRRGAPLDWPLAAMHALLTGDVRSGRHESIPARPTTG
jgi:hypothetical protein